MRGVIYQYFVNGKYYVGKTYMQERKRIDKHKYEALTLKKDHPFCKAIRKYGWEVVRKSYVVIEEVFAENVYELNRKLIERESYWIRERNSIVPNGYNIYSKGTKTPPHQNEKERIYKKVSESLKGKYMNHPSTSKRVYCVEQKRWYLSESEAERQNNLSRGSVGKAASGKNVTAGGLSWNYTGSSFTRDDKIKSSRKKIVCVETGVVYESIYAAAKSLFGEFASSKKCRIQNSLKRGWAVDGKHFQYIEQANPVLSEKEV